jgi:hypothetical protein
MTILPITPLRQRDAHQRFGTQAHHPAGARTAQIDWAHVGTLRFAGGTRQLWAFVMVLAYSARSGPSSSSTSRRSRCGARSCVRAVTSAA